MEVEVKMKKLLSLIFGILFGCLFILFSALLTEVLLSIGEYQDVLYVTLGIIFVVMIVSFVIVCVLNRYFDRSEGYASKTKWIGRWGKNTLFVSLVLSFLCACIEFLTERNQDPLKEQQNIFYLYLLVGAVICGIIYYIQNYRKLLTRKTRINYLIHQNEKYKGRRYTFVVMDVQEDDKNIVLKGNVLGNIHVHDDVFVYAPSQPRFMTRVLSIKESDKDVKKSKDSKIEITLKNTEQTKNIKVGTVLSDIKACLSKEPENNVENPIVRGLIAGFNELRQNPEKASLLFWVIANSQFLLCGKSTTKREDDIVDTMKDNAQVSFMSVSTSNDDSLFILPAFTDWDALNCWTMMMEEKDAVSLVMDYKDVEGIMEQGFGGIVINPFGPQPFFIPKELAVTMLNMVMRPKEEKEME